MTNNKFHTKTSIPLSVIFLLVITFSMVMVPIILSNNSFSTSNTTVKSPDNMANKQGDDEGIVESIPETQPESTPKAEEESTTGTEPSDKTTLSTDNGTSNSDPITSEGPDRDCLFNPSLPKCAAIDGGCPEGFNQNGDEQCVPEGGCPEGYHTVDDDESGQCIPNSEGCPSGMIFRTNEKTCGYKDDICKQYPDLNVCIETPQECDNNKDDDGDGLVDSADPDCKLQPPCDPSYPDKCIPSAPPDLDCRDIVYKNFKVSSSDPHGFDRDNDGVGCETNSEPEPESEPQESQTVVNTITVPQDACPDLSNTVKLGPGQIESKGVRIIAFFDTCELESASLFLNLVPDENLKLVVANFEINKSDAAEVTITPIIQQSNQNQVFYKTTIAANQEGYDLETGEIKTVNNVNGIVLWNSGDEPIEFVEDNTVRLSIDFYN